jgi:hypothetical protein
MQDVASTVDSLFRDVYYNRKLEFDISDFIQYDGKIYNGKTFIEEILSKFQFEFWRFTVLIRRHSHKALRVAYTQNPNRDLWMPVVAEALEEAHELYKADKIVWLAREMDARGDLDRRTAERLASHVYYTAFFEIGPAEISWMRAALDLDAQ